MRTDSTRCFDLRLAALLLATAMLLLSVGCRGISKPPPLPPNAIAPIIAVTRFEDRSGYDGGWRLTRDMSDLLVSELIWSERFELVERRELGGVFEELVQQASEFFREEGKASPGQLKNARFQIRGQIDEFDQVAGGDFWLSLRRVFVAGRAFTARVALTLTVVEVETGQIVTSVKGAGYASARETFAEARYEDLAFGGEAFFRTPIGNATRDALRQAVVQAVEAIPFDIWRPVVAATPSDGTVVINGGYEQGIPLGAVYRVRKPAQPITDPITGDVLSWVAGGEIGHVRVVSVDQRVAVAEILDGEGFERGQALSPLSVIETDELHDDYDRSN